MNALLLAAGVGSRLRPITNFVPKCMVPIAGRPLLSYWLELLLSSPDVGRVVINTHHLPHPVQVLCESTPHQGRISIFHEEELLGTGGTLLSQMGALGGRDLLVAHADNLTLFDPGLFLSHHRARPANTLITMMTFDSDRPESCGIVELDMRGCVIAFHEKVPNPPGRLANAAVYLFSPEALSAVQTLFVERVTDRKLIDLSIDVIPYLVGRISTYHNSIFHRDIGTPEALHQARRDFPAVYERFRMRDV